MKEEDLFLLGTIIKPKGLKGSLKLGSLIFSGLPNKPFGIFISKNSKLIPYQALNIKAETKDLVLTLAGIERIEDAIPLVGHTVYALKEDFSLKKPVFSYLDLKGYQLIDDQDGPLGPILEVLEMPQQWIAVLEENGLELLIPLNENLILKIDKKNKKLLCHLPEGLLDIYRNP